MRLILIVISFIFFIFSFTANAAYYYIDAGSIESGVTWSGVNGESYTSTDSDFPGAGTGYTTIIAAFAEPSTEEGHHFYLRGGTYQEGFIEIPTTMNNATSWSSLTTYNSIQSYPGEWAILDGQRSTSGGVVIGRVNSGTESANSVNYWLFERLEIMGGGRTSGGQSCAAIWVNVGPNKFRYLYIHDNLSWTYLENPGGLVGLQWQDSIVEYCYFDNNGSSGAKSHNDAHINIFSDYSPSSRKVEIATNGFDDVNGTKRNIYRYNYLNGSEVAIKHKGAQLLSKRGTDAHPEYWEDEFVAYGDDIHHNIIDNTSDKAVIISQDFTQFHNNIIIDPPIPAICVAYALDGIEVLYKVSVYNNTIMSPLSAGITRLGSPEYTDEEVKMYGADYNNLISEGDATPGYHYCSVSYMNYSCYNGSQNPYIYDMTDLRSSHNYFYDPGDPDLYKINRVDGGYEATGYLTAAEYEAQTTITHQTNKEVYSTSGDSPFVGGGGANNYITVGSTVLEDTTTIANGGIGGDHPYVPGVTIPSYVGATNPDDNTWVAGVLALDASYFTSAIAGSDPAWIEGAEDESTPSISRATIMGGCINYP